MKFKNLFIVIFIALIPVAFFGGCGSSTQPISPSNSSTLSIQIPPVGAHSEFIPAAQNMILYNISGSGSSITGSYGPLSATAVTGQISFSIKLPANVGTYNLISLEIEDNVTQKALAVGALALSNANGIPVTLGPLNKGFYTLTDFPSGYGFGFESDAATVVSGPTTAAGIDVVSNTNSAGYELDDPALANSTVAYMGNGNFVNYLKVPTNFSSTSSLSKKAVVGGTVQAVAVGDVYCVKMKAGGYAWLQITGAGVVGVVSPSFVFRLNTTVSYCGYEQSTVDAAASAVHGTPTPYAPIATVTFAENSYGIAVIPSNAAAVSVLVTDAGAMTNTAYVHVFNPNLTAITTFGSGNLSGANGIGVNAAGTTIYVADPISHKVAMFSSAGGFMGSVGAGSNFTPPDTNVAAMLGQMGSPEFVAVAPAGNVFITDAGTNGFADVLVMQAPTTVSGNAVTYWSGQLSTSTASNGIATDGTTVYIADAAKNQIEAYNVNGLTGVTWTNDNNPAGTVAFSGPQAIALDSVAGLLFIADTGNNRVVEMTTLGIFKATWGTWGLGTGVTPSTMSGPAAIAVDGANPPNVYVVDTNNRRVLQFKGL